MYRLWLIAGAANMLLALIIAAAVGHRLEGEFVPVIRAIFDTAREMHFVHALALIAVGIVSAQFGRKLMIDLAGWAFLVGIVCFCGGIYLGFGPNATQVRPLIPIGGVALMAGWVLFAAGALFLKRPVAAQTSAASG
jgi:uncharacterized membrane protein YgdD (TMEM256/DUF423 family)